MRTQRIFKKPVYAGTQGRRDVLLQVRKTARQGQYAAGRQIRVIPGFTRRVGNYARYGAQALAAGMKPELKFFDTALSFTVDATGEVPATGQLTLIPQGDTESTRDGRKAVIKSIQIRGIAYLAPGAAATAATVAYVYVVLDTQANGAAAGVTDVFTSNNLSSALINLNNSGRFRILKKFVLPFVSPAGATTAYNNVVKPLEFWKSCNIDVDWSSTAGAITELRSNNIFLLAGSDGLSDDTVTVVGNCRLRFMG